MTWERAIPNQKIVDMNATFIVAFIRITHNFLMLCIVFYIKPNTFFRAVAKRGQPKGDQGPQTFLTYVKENRSRNRKYTTSGSPKFSELPTALPLFDFWEKVVNRCGWIRLYFICIFAKKNNYKILLPKKEPHIIILFTQPRSST